MPLLFTHFCDLLAAIEDCVTRRAPLSPAKLRQERSEIIKSWFSEYRVSVNSPEIDVVVLLSSLFPAKRIDRVYCIKSISLTRSLRRWLGLGASRWPQLDQWQTPNRGDLSNCVERVLQEAEFPFPHNRNRVTLEEVDNALAVVAARCRFSAPRVKTREMDKDDEVGRALEVIYQRLQSREAKWFTRLILKDFPRLDLPENLIYACIDPRMRVAMQMYHDFESAISELRNLPSSQMLDSAGGGFTQQYANDSRTLPPRIGVKLGPPKWIKAKGGVKHAVSIIDGRTMSVERKHDGEYCQIHIDLSKGQDCIQIFSKSGKDSTEDRKGVHQAIRNGLRIGHPDCKFSRQCILEGELLVYSDRSKEILEFHKIRKHVSRSGSFLGTALDSQPHYWEHLMIMFYDVMLVDDTPVLHQPHRERRHLLRKLVKRIEGQSDCTFHAHVRFSKSEGPKNLKRSLALAFVRRWEGLVLKPYDEPYYDLSRPVKGRYPSRWIKLKKDCIKGLGDTADFAVIGGGYDAGKAAKLNFPNIRWTHFYIGCLRNKCDVTTCGAKPQILVFDEISDCIKEEDMKTLNEHGRIREMLTDSNEAHELFNIEYASGMPKMTAVFRCPFVFEVAGNGFDKSPNRDIFTLRFPRVVKVHWDRDWKESVGLDELQQMAAEAMRTHPSETSKPFNDEVDAWVEKLDGLERGAQGHLTAWDYSEDDDDDEVGTDVAKGIAFVRMDTTEMHTQEQRLSSGEVVDRSSSKYSTTSDCSLAPPSSLFSNDYFKEAASCTHSKQRKRSADTDSQDVSRRLKKARPQAIQHTKNDKPLHEITNNARRSTQSRSTNASRQTKSATTSDFSLVRKLPLATGELCHRKYAIPRVMPDPSSPGRETTASPSTAAPTTQSTVDHVVEAVTLPPSHAPKPKPTPNPPSLPTPPSTADPPPEVHLPILFETKIILSPHLIKDGKPIPPLPTLLTSLNIHPSSLDLSLQQPCAPAIFTSTPQKTMRIAILLDTADTTDDTIQATRSTMWKTLKNVQIWHPIAVEFWDWRVLHAVEEVGGDGDGKGAENEERRQQGRKWFAARIRWDEAWEGKGGVEIKLGDGSVHWVSKEEFC